MDQAILNAIRRRDELQNELSDIETFLRLYSRFGGRVEREPAKPESVAPEPELVPALSEPEPAEQAMQQKLAETEPHQAPPPVARVRTRGTPPEQLAMKALEILRGTETIVDRGELAQMVENSGMLIGSQDKPQYIKVVLDRFAKDQFEVHGRGLKAAPEVIHLEGPQENAAEKEYDWNDSSPA